MTVFIGETGAGKSIFIEALSLLAGARFSSDVIGNYDDSVIIEGIFTFKKDSKAFKLLSEHEYLGDDEWVFSRLLTKAGRSIYRINGQVTNLQLVKEVLSEEIDIHSQFESQQLLNSKYQLHLLDSLMDNQERLKAVETAYNDLISIRKKKKQFLEEELSQNEMEFIKFQLNELKTANLNVLEEEQLNQEVKRLTNLYNAKKTLANTVNHLNKLDLSSLHAAFTELSRINDLSNNFPILIDEMKNHYYGLEEISLQVNQMLTTEENESNLDQLQERLFEYSRIKRKYQMETKELIAYQNKMEEQLSLFEDRSYSLKQFEKQEAAAYSKYQELAKVLSQLRKQGAKRLEADLRVHLDDLKLENAQFQVIFKEGEFSTGVDEVDFLVQMNPGANFSSLAKTASGGELSRFMLALKTVFNKVSPVTTLVFDEIDTGVSGEVALQMGLKMNQLAKDSQLIVISHLPAVAASADQLFLISKKSEKDSTEVKIKGLDGDETISEIAKLAFAKSNQSALTAAKDLIKLVEQMKDE